VVPNFIFARAQVSAWPALRISRLASFSRFSRLIIAISSSRSNAPRPKQHSHVGPRKSTGLPNTDRATSLRTRAFYPLTLPITVGPGSIAVAIALGTGSPHAGLQPVHLAGVGVALVLLCLIIFFCVRYSGRLEKPLGKVGTQIAVRLFAFVLFCIGVQLLWTSLSGLIGSLHLH
jgi:small neutral amino acid transporter SnatA (MarC family)